MRACVYVCVHVFACVCLRVFACVCVRVYVCFDQVVRCLPAPGGSPPAQQQHTLVAASQPFNNNTPGYRRST